MKKPFYQRKSPRLQGYDYTQNGAYFVTICTHERQHLFGKIVDDKMQLNQSGKIAHKDLQNLTSHWNIADVDFFVVMPNHIHVIIIITDTNDDNDVPLSQIIGGYKSGVTRQIRHMLNQPKFVVWQKRFHDHIIRTEKSLNYIREYVLSNPTVWSQDTLYS